MAFAPGHQYPQCWLRTHLFPAVYGLKDYHIVTQTLKAVGMAGLHKIETGLGTKFQDKFSAWFSRNFMLSGKSENVHSFWVIIYRTKN